MRAVTNSFYSCCLLPALILVSFISCRQNSKNELTVYRTLYDGLIMSNQDCRNQLAYLRNALDDKLANPDSKSSAEIWHPRAIEVMALSDELIAYIGSVKATLEKELRKVNGGKDLPVGEENTAVVSKVFDEGGVYQKLQDKMNEFKIKILSIDPDMNKQFENAVPDKILSGITGPSGEMIIKPPYFTHIPVGAAMALLAKCEYQVLHTSQEMVTFCFYRINNYGAITHERTAPLISVSSSVVKPAESITITAGIGTFFIRTLPDIMINNRKINLDGEPMGQYHFKASIKPGEYKVPVKIEFTGPDGVRQTLNREIHYTVVAVQ